ncbi:DUF3325 family protein [Halarcobacter sp.]|uniref:DUF3325 family protein n=1 Tax=Halarcobacter sp. TaxID=2321133 RepID=UPI0029F4F1A7|nr:DUF3325 family protein [Halarcobacter sp.]
MVSMSLYLTYLGLFLLSLVLNKHYKEVLGKDANKIIKLVCIWLGYLILAISLYAIIQIFGLSLGITYWLGLVGIIIVFIAMIYTYYPKFIIKLSALLLIITLFFTLI